MSMLLKNLSLTVEKNNKYYLTETSYIKQVQNFVTSSKAGAYPSGATDVAHNVNQAISLTKTGQGQTLQLILPHKQ